MENFLKSTKYCDSDNPEIRNIAINLTKQYKHERDKAVVLFNFVRDNILYKFDFWNLKASDTLKKKSGMCTNKNNLLIACLRAINILAGYGILKVKAREYFGPIMIDFFRNKISETSVHIYTQVYLNNRWVKCDPSTDRNLSEKTSYFNYSTELINWNGISNAMDKILPEHIDDDEGPFDNVDENLDKKPKNITYFKIKLANLYLHFLRTTDEYFKDYEHREKAFLKWLRKKNYFYYLYIKINA